MIQAVLILALLLASTPSQPELAQSPAATIASLSTLADALPTAPLATVPSLLPSIIQATADSDPHLRSLAFLVLISLTNRTRSDGTLSNDALPLLEPYLPTLTQHLADPDAHVAQLTSVFLGGFLTKPSPAVLSPLLATLNLPTPPTQSHLSVIVALLTLGADSSVHPEIAPAILRFLLRADLPSPLLASFIRAIANHPGHIPTLDQSLLTFLDSTHPPPVREAVITILPRLALTQPEVESTRASLTRLVKLATEDASVKAQAAAILPCWHRTRSPDPCPSPGVHFHMLPPPPRSPVTPPRYQSPPLSLAPQSTPQTN